MSKLMYVLGIILLAAGVALAVMGLVNQAPLLARGIDMGSAILLIVGGVLAIGLAGVIGALGGISPSATMGEVARAPEPEPDLPVAAAPKATEAEQPASLKFPSFSRKSDVAATASTAAAATAAIGAGVVAEKKPELSPSVKETITALEQAKTDLENAFAEKAEDASVDAAPAETGESELFVVEDKIIRGRPARVLSDGTVEAETEEGWMRFENLDHLDEYLDAIEQA
jgi:hypothetical protein